MFEKRGQCTHTLDPESQKVINTCVPSDSPDPAKYAAFIQYWKGQLTLSKNLEMSSSMATNKLRNPTIEFNKDKGWEITSHPDFRPMDGAGIVDQGAYELGGVNWIPGYQPVPRGVSVAALIQSSFGDVGNFEVVVQEGNQLCHWYRDNEDSALEWQPGRCFAEDVTPPPQHIEVVVTIERYALERIFGLRGDPFVVVNINNTGDMWSNTIEGVREGQTKTPKPNEFRRTINLGTLAAPFVVPITIKMRDDDGIRGPSNADQLIDINSGGGRRQSDLSLVYDLKTKTVNIPSPQRGDDSRSRGKIFYKIDSSDFEDVTALESIAKIK